MRRVGRLQSDGDSATMFVHRSKEYPPVEPLLVRGATLDVERPVRPESLTMYPMGKSRWPTSRRAPSRTTRGPRGSRQRTPAVRSSLPRRDHRDRCHAHLRRSRRPLFEGEEAVLHVIERIVAPLGLRVDATSPWVDA